MPRFIIAMLSMLTLTISSYGQTADEYNKEGNALKTDKKIPEAIAAYKQAVKADPTHREAWYNMGWCQNDTKDYTGALTSLRKARGFGYKTAAMYFELGYAFTKLSMNDSAIRNYNLCLEINPTYSLVFKQLGYIAYEKEDYPPALQNFQKYEMYAKSPINDYLYWYRKGFINNAVKNYDSAKVALNKSLALKQDYLNTYLELGYSCSRLKQNEESISYYKRAMDVDPKSHVPYNGIAEVYRDNYKNIEEAMSWYGKTLAMNSNERKANFGMGYCHNSKGNYSTAIPYLKKAIEQEATYTAAYVELGYAYHQNGDSEAALENLKKALNLNPANENARYYSGLVYIKQGNKSMAQKMVDELKQLNSKNTTSLQEKVNKM